MEQSWIKEVFRNTGCIALVESTTKKNDVFLLVRPAERPREHLAGQSEIIGHTINPLKTERFSDAANDIVGLVKHITDDRVADD